MTMFPPKPAAGDASTAAAGTELDFGLVEVHEHSGSAFAGFPPPPPREILDAAGELLRALAAPVRIAIVLQLRESRRCVHELVDALSVPQPLVSQHLKILKAAGVVAGERSGREVLYRLADHHLAHIVMATVAHAGEGTAVTRAGDDDAGAARIEERRS
jgi:DNA-binding transcriptional ArsR family regulator